MAEQLFIEIANEIKGLNQSALSCISKNDVDQAHAYFEQALALTTLCQYNEGIAMTLYNMANLESLKSNLIQATDYALQARDFLIKSGKNPDSCDLLLDQLSLATMKKGMDYERNGNLRHAIEHYKSSVPFAKPPYKDAMTAEIELIERILGHE